jgi:hypothetical protein
MGESMGNLWPGQPHPARLLGREKRTAPIETDQSPIGSPGRSKFHVFFLGLHHDHDHPSVRVGRYAKIDITSDDILLEIFNFYVDVAERIEE